MVEERFSKIMYQDLCFLVLAFALHRWCLLHGLGVFRRLEYCSLTTSACTCLRDNIAYATDGKGDFGVAREWDVGCTYATDRQKGKEEIIQ